jgi:hypothetical protein
MTWLWFAAPLVAVVVYVLAGRRDERRDAAIARWRKAAGNPRRTTSLPGPSARILETTGGGTPLGYFELAPKLAHLAIMGADALQGSDHATVVAKLDEPGPTFTVRPLPIVEGQRIPNTGVQFRKDPAFMALFLVEPTLEEGPVAPVREADEKAIRKWLSPPLREALLEFPDGWLRVDGRAKAMAFTLYGPADAQRFDELIAAADIVFAEYGAEGGPSLLPDEAKAESDEPEPKAESGGPKQPPPKKKASSGGAKASAAKR